MVIICGLSRGRRLSIAVAACLLLATQALSGEPRTVTFKTFDGVDVSADFYAPQSSAAAPIAILLHMEQGDRRDWAAFAAGLSRAGFAALAVDLRGHGVDATTAARDAVAQRLPVVFAEMFQDVRAAYDWLAPQPGVDRARFVLLGAGMGASVALRYAAEDRSVDGVIALSPSVEYCGLNSRGDLAKLQGRRCLLIASRDDRAAAETLGGSSKNATVEFVEGTGRGTQLLKSAGLAGRLSEAAKSLAGAAVDAPVYASMNSEVYHLAGSGWIETIKPTNLRCFSTPREAEERGLRRAKSRKPSDFRKKGDD